jgi:hypothetical protein
VFEQKQKENEIAEKIDLQESISYSQSYKIKKGGFEKGVTRDKVHEDKAIQ